MQPGTKFAYVILKYILPIGNEKLISDEMMAEGDSTNKIGRGFSV